MRRSPLLSTVDVLPPQSKRKVTSIALLIVGLWGLASPALAQGNPPVTGATATYQIELETGTNLVALPVAPTPAAVTDIVAGVLSHLTFVQDEDGRYFVPAQGVDELGTWNGEEVYKIEVASPTILTVEGPEILPQFSPISLEASVVNWVPYTRREPMAVAEAFASIASSLDKVEASDRRFYRPGDATSTLDSLHVGEGYKVWVSQSTSLLYPANPAQQTDGSAVNTLGEALALTGLTPGQEIEVLGYYAPGDGGGGTFLVTDGGETPDGGLVFVPYEAQSGPITNEGGWGNSPNVNPFSGIPAGEDVVYGSVTMTAIDGFNGGTELFTVGDEHFHGHRHNPNSELRPLVDYDLGTFTDPYSGLYVMFDELNGSAGNGWVGGRLRFTFRHTTSDLRLVRQGVGNTINVRWFGARTAAEDPTFDNQPIIAQAINAAVRLNAAAPGSVTTVLLPDTGDYLGGDLSGTYLYFGGVEIPDGLTLAGAAGTELVTATDDLGNTFQPVRVRGQHTRLKVMDGEALKHVRMLKPLTDPFRLPWDAKMALRTRFTAISPSEGAMAATIRDIVLDGNWEGNQQIFTEGWGTFQEKEEWMRNSPGWAGFVSTNHGGRNIPIGQQLTVTNVAVLGYGANGLLGYVNNEWTVTNALLGNSVWNHVLYNASGTYTNLTLTGFAWGHTAWYRGTVTNLVYENQGHPPAGPYRPGGAAFDMRGGDYYDVDDQLAGGSDQYIRTDGTPAPLGTTVDGFYMDFRGTRMHSPFSGVGRNIHARNGVVIRSELEGFRPAGLMRENANGYQSRIYLNNRFENVRIYDNSNPADGSGGVLGALWVTESVFRNIHVDTAALNASGSAAASFHFSATKTRDDTDYTHPSQDLPRSIVVDDVVNEVSTIGVIKTDVDADSPGMDIFVLNSAFNNNTTGVVLTRQHAGTMASLERLGGSADDLRVYWRDTNIKLYDGPSPENAQAFYATGYFDGVTDTEGGYTSEDEVVVAFTATAGQTESPRVPTNLIRSPIDPSYVTVTAQPGKTCPATSWEFWFEENWPDPVALPYNDFSATPRRGPSVKLFFDPLTAGQVIGCDVAMAVRPWPDGVTVPEYAQ